jgi:elongator complex protein 3
MARHSTLATTIIEASLREKIQTKQALFTRSRELASGESRRMPAIPMLLDAYNALVKADPSKRSPILERLLKRRDVRSLSGVAIITVLTKPYPCPGACVYCPTEAIMPKSYLSNEPAAMRALLNKFDPWAQVETRLDALTKNGHPADKIELIVKGGTWSAYDWRYQQWFIKRCFDACNAFNASASARSRTATLDASQKRNEKAGHRIIGLTLETRPDWITPQEILRLRALGCTRVELGVQSIDDAILDATKRGHGTAAVVRAAKLLKDAGYKTDFHMMPQLPGATPESDGKELVEIFENADFRPDMIKIYPMVVVELAEIYEQWKRGEYVPYSDEELIEMIIQAKTRVPRYCRISRLIRDIPSTSIVAGNMATNLRQIIQDRMKVRGLKCSCLRCREIGRVGTEDPSLMLEKPVAFDDKYEASGGLEHFLSFEDAKRRGVYAFCRLRLPPKEARGDMRKVWDAFPVLKGAALIRELHTYGRLVPIDGKDINAAQHKGLGKKLMKEAERIAKAAGYKKLVVISGIGVREYYRKLGYRLQGTYMVKTV